MSERIVTPGMRTTERDVVRNYLVSERKPLASFNSRRSTTGHGYSDQRIPVLTARQVAQCLTMEEFLRLNLRIVQLLDLGFHSDEEDLAAVDRPLDVLRDLVAEPNRGGMGMTAEQLARHGTGQLELIYMGRFCGLSAADNLFEKPPDGVGLTLDLMHTHSSTLPLAQLVEWCGLEASHLIEKCKWQFFTEDVGAWTLSDFKLLGFTAPMLAERCALTKENLCAIGWTLGEWISLGLTGEVLDRLDVQDQYDLPALWDQKKLRILLGKQASKQASKQSIPPQPLISSSDTGNRYRIEGPENGDDVSGDVEDATSSTSRERYPLATTTTTTGRERYPPATTRESYPLAAAARLPPPLVVPRPSDGRGLRRIVPTVPRGELQWQPAPGKSQQQQRPAARPGAGRG